LWLETGLFKCIVEFFRRKLVAFAVGERLLVNREEIRGDRGVPLVPAVLAALTAEAGKPVSHAQDFIGRRSDGSAVVVDSRPVERRRPHLQRRSLEGDLWLETGLFKCIVEFFLRKLVAFAVGERLLVNRKEIRRDRGVPVVPRLGVAPPVAEDIELRCIPMMLTAEILSHRA